MTASAVKQLASECGFELAGVTPAQPLADAAHFLEWIAGGMAGEMKYLTDHRADRRTDPRSLLPSAKSVICVGKLYNTGAPYSTALQDTDAGWISRYAWGDDYHEVMRAGLERLVRGLQERAGDFDYKICVDTAPLLERSYARMAGLGWIGKNTCLINQGQGSWFFLGEVLVSLELDAELENDAAPPDRCGTCTRCIDACPTEAIVPRGTDEGPEYTLDARRCISYFTIELRGTIPEELRSDTSRHLFGCDICQDVCPWNSRAAVTDEEAFLPRNFLPRLDELASLSEDEFRERFRRTPVWRAKYAGFLRNVAVAMGNSKDDRFRKPLERLAQSADEEVAGHAVWALRQLDAAAKEKAS